jgi:predicted nuclease of predicted toxin-antitoxin system
LRFLVDAQLPPALARRLESLGHRAEHVADHGMTSASDNAIWEYAASVGAVIVTKDEDFAIRRLLTAGPAIVWLRLGNSRRVALLARIEAELPVVVAALERGEALVEVM